MGSAGVQKSVHNQETKHAGFCLSKKKERNKPLHQLEQPNVLISAMATSNGVDREGTVISLRTEFVKPHKPLCRKDCQLISFDLYYLPCRYSQRLLIYKSAENFGEVEEKLKAGLRAVLEDFYPLAGKIRKDEEGILRVEYDDDMDGVEFTIAASLDIHVAQMITRDPKIAAVFKEFFPCNGVYNWEGLYSSLLHVKLTKLKDGFALGCAFNHGVVDGTSIWQFMKAWAERCNGCTSVSVKPFHDRIKARNTRPKLDIPLKLHDPNFISKKDLPVATERFFSFSESAVNKIKSNLNNSTNDGTKTKPFSTFQCLATHVWRAVTRARQLNPGDLTVFTVFANLRNRFDHPMPESYFGNLIFPIRTATSASDLLSGPPNACASMIRKAIEKLDSNAVDKDITEWETNPAVARKLTDLGVNVVAFGSSPKFKIYDIDFGWGEPERVWMGSNNQREGMVYLHQGKSGGGSIDVDICLEAEAMKRLEADKEFLMKDD